MYYTEEEMSGALQRACCTIDTITESCENYTRGVNDCFALVAEYDLELRGQSKARDLINFQWKSTREFAVKLSKEGYSLPEFGQYCGYEVVRNKRPQLGDIAFHFGAMVHDGTFWISTDENNSGTTASRQAFFLERHTTLIARPIRSL